MHLTKNLELIVPEEFRSVFHQNGESHFKAFFNFLYYLCFAPFKVEADGESEEYVLKRNRLQQILCAMVHLVALGLGNFYIFEYIDVISSTPDVSYLFFAVGNLACYIAIVLLLKILWFDQSKLLRMVETTRVSFPARKKRVLKALLLGMLMWWYAAHLCMSLLSTFGLDAISTTVDMSLGKIVRICEGYLGASESWPWSLIFLRTMATVILEILIIQATNLFHISRIIIMVSSLSFLAMGKEFENSIKNESCLKNVIQNYDNLRNAVEETNDTVGSIMLAQYISILMFLANSPSLRNGVVDNSSIEKCYITFTYVLYGAFLVVACDMPKRIRIAWKKWMIKKRMCGELTLEERLLMVTFNQDVESESLGLSCTFFTLTYSFLGSMIGLVTTYGILIYQMKK